MTSSKWSDMDNPPVTRTTRRLKPVYNELIVCILCLTNCFCWAEPSDKIDWCHSIAMVCVNRKRWISQRLLRCQPRDANLTPVFMMLFCWIPKFLTMPQLQEVQLQSLPTIRRFESSIFIVIHLTYKLSVKLIVFYFLYTKMSLHVLHIGLLWVRDVLAVFHYLVHIFWRNFNRNLFFLIASHSLYSFSCY